MQVHPRNHLFTFKPFEFVRALTTISAITIVAVCVVAGAWSSSVALRALVEKTHCAVNDIGRLFLKLRGYPPATDSIELR